MAKEDKKLESALKQLEEIVDGLSNKEIDVEAGLEKFKEGVGLIKFCRGQLQQAENEFEKLKGEIESAEEDSSYEKQ